MIKVLLISHAVNLSGAPFSLFYLAKSFKNDPQVKIKVVLPEFGNLAESLKKEAIDFEILGKFKLFKLIKIIRQEKANIIHLNSSVSVKEGILAKIMKQTLVWHIREDLSSNFFRCFLINFLADKIIVISDFVGRFFKDKTKVSKIYNALSFDDLPKPTYFKKKQQQAYHKNKCFNIGFLGSIEPRKGVLNLVKAFLNCKKAKLHLAGEIPNHGKAYFHKIKKTCQKAKNPIKLKHFFNYYQFKRINCLEIVYWGSLKSPFSFIDLMDIIIVPSLSEPFGRVVIEAMSRGKIVIASNCGGIPEIITDSYNGFLVQANYIELLNKMKKVLNLSQAKKDSLAKNARKIVLQKFEIKQQKKLLCDVYKQVNKLKKN